MFIFPLSNTEELKLVKNITLFSVDAPLQKKRKKQYEHRQKWYCYTYISKHLIDHTLRPCISIVRHIGAFQMSKI